MTSAEDVENWDTGSPNAEVDQKDPRTRDPNATTEGKNRKVNGVETDEDPYCDEVVLSQLFYRHQRHHLTQND